MTTSNSSLSGRYIQLALETAACTSGVTYDSLDGAQLFNAWLQASKEEAINHLKNDGGNLNTESGSKFDVYMERCKEARSQGYIFDSVYRILRPVLYGVDTCLDNTTLEMATKVKPSGGSDTWFTFRPFAVWSIAHAGASTQFGLMLAGCTNKPQQQEQSMKCCLDFFLQILSMETRRNLETVSLLSQQLIRRHVDRFATSISVIDISNHTTGTMEVNKHIEYLNGTLLLRIVSIPVSPIIGHVVNHHLSLLSQQSECMDLIFLYNGDDSAEEFVDRFIRNSGFRLFIPAYPIHVPHNLLILTPIQVVQFNGCRNSCLDVASVYRSILTRISITLGAVLRPTSAVINSDSDTKTTENDTTCMYEEVAHVEDREWFTSGIHNVRRESWIVDGRMVWILQPKKSDSSLSPTLSTKAEPAQEQQQQQLPALKGGGFIGRHVTYCHHGWCSGDTRTLLLTAIRHYRPRCVLELGTWYGKSSRFILKHLSKVSSEDGLSRTLFCVDKFKNNAVYNSLRSEIQPEDKMFFNFLRYESFISSVEDLALQNSDVEKYCSVCAVKMDIHESVEALHNLSVPIDMIFIDAEKKSYPLTQLILKIRRKFPNAVIVGDDHIFESVQIALQRLEKQGVVAHKRNEAYLISPANSSSSSNRPDINGMWRVKKSAKSSAFNIQGTSSRSAFRAVEQTAEDEVAIDCGIHEVGAAITDFVRQGRTKELKELLFHPQCPLFKVYISGQPSFAHTFMTHYMKIRRQLEDQRKEGSSIWKLDVNDHTTNPNSTAHSTPSWTPEIQSEMLEIAVRIVDSISEDNMSYSEGMLSIFDLISHDIVFQ